MNFRNDIITATNATQSGGGSDSFVGHCLAHDDKNPSLSIKFVEDQKNPLLHCHAGCSQESVIESFKAIGLWSSNQKSDKPVYNKSQKSNYIKEIIRESTAIKSTVAEKYIFNRGIVLTSSHENSLRFHPNLSYSKDLCYPALIGLLRNSNNLVTAVQRIFLTNQGYKIAQNAKKIFGDKEKSIIKLFPIEKKVSSVHICEGIETGLAIHSAINEMVIITISANQLANIDIDHLKKITKSVHIWADNDNSKTGEKEARKAFQHYSKNGFKVFLHMPSNSPQNGQKSYDFLDQYNDHGPESLIKSLNNFETNDITPIKAPEYNLPKMDEHYFHPEVWSWVKRNSDKLNVSPEMVAIPLFTLIAGLISRRFSVTPKMNDKSFKVYPNLWGIIIAPPGSKKSPAMNQSYKFISKLQNLEIKSFKMVEDEFKAQQDFLKGELKTIEQKIRKTKNEIDIPELEAEKNKIEEELNKSSPSCLRKVVNSTTIEKLIQTLQEQNAGLIVFRDELAGFFEQFKKSGHETDRQFYLEGWNGNNSFFHDTVSRGTDYVEKVCLTILGSTQPSIIKEILKQAQFANKEDGFLQRFQLAVYPNDNISPKFKDVYYDSSYDETIEKVITHFFYLKNEVDIVYSNDSIAYKIYSDYFDALEREIFNEKNDSVKAHFSKFNKLTPALSLIFELVDEFLNNRDSNHLISNKSMELAIKWTNFLKSHARKIYNTDYSFQTVSAHALAIKIIEEKVKSGDSIRDIYKNGWSHLKDQIEVETAAKILEKHNWLTISETKGVGRPSVKISLNEELFDFIETNKWWV